MHKSYNQMSFKSISLLLLLNIYSVFTSNLRIASWNLGRFGEAKARDSNAMNIILKTLLQYDVVAIQEITSQKIEPFNQLVNQLNNASSKHYQGYVGPRLGSTKYKEQYAFIFNDQVSLINTLQFNDTNNQFERPPTIAIFKLIENNMSFAMINIHTKPDTTVKEIDSLVDVYDSLTNILDNVIILGDFNAGCAYVREIDWLKIRLRTDDRFYWWIQDNVKTNVAKSQNCSYDRFVTRGDMMNSLIVSDGENAPRAFYFDQVYNLTEELVKKVSDHYPIEMMLHIPSPYATNDWVKYFIVVMFLLILTIASAVATVVYCRRKMSHIRYNRVNQIL